MIKHTIKPTYKKFGIFNKIRDYLVDINDPVFGYMFLDEYGRYESNNEIIFNLFNRKFNFANLLIIPYKNKEISKKQQESYLNFIKNKKHIEYKISNAFINYFKENDKWIREEWRDGKKLKPYLIDYLVALEGGAILSDDNIINCCFGFDLSNSDDLTFTIYIYPSGKVSLE